MPEVKYYLACLDHIKKKMNRRHAKRCFFPLNKKVKGICLCKLVAYSEKTENKQWTKQTSIQLGFLHLLSADFRVWRHLKNTYKHQTHTIGQRKTALPIPPIPSKIHTAKETFIHFKYTKHVQVNNKSTIQKRRERTCIQHHISLNTASFNMLSVFFY